MFVCASVCKCIPSRNEQHELNVSSTRLLEITTYAYTGRVSVQTLTDCQSPSDYVAPCSMLLRIFLFCFVLFSIFALLENTSKELLSAIDFAFFFGSKRK